MGCVYQITNLVNGKRYIGATTQLLSRRWADHIAKSKRKDRGRFHCAIKSYGEDLFKPIVLLEADDDKIWLEEARLIALWKPEYNLAAGGRIAYGWKMDPDSVEKRVAKFRGVKRPLISILQKEIIRQKMAKVGGANFTKHMWSKTSTPIICTTNDTIYRSQSTAAKELGIFQANIHKVLSGVYKSTSGYSFEYAVER